MLVYSLCILWQVIRLLGLLGALDPYKHKLNGMESAGAVVLSMWEPGGERSDGAGG